MVQAIQGRQGAVGVRRWRVRCGLSTNHPEHHKVPCSGSMSALAIMRSMRARKLALGNGSVEEQSDGACYLQSHVSTADENLPGSLVWSHISEYHSEAVWERCQNKRSYELDEQR